MDSVKMNVMICAMVLVLIVHGGKCVEAQVHHVVGDDRGWDVGSNIASWADGRTFAVGDFLWFAYSDGLDKDKVVELKSRDEFESCDVSNPIMMFTEGVEKISLENEGNRYFASSNIESCKKGLKLPIEVVKSKSTIEKESLRSSIIEEKVYFLAEGPSPPSSSSAKIYGSVTVVVFTMILSYVGL